MADNTLLSAIQVGASIGNMRVLQQERLMRLRSEQAMQQVKERQIAEELSLRMQMFQQKEQERVNTLSALKAAESLRLQGVPEETINAGLKYTSPQALELVQKATEPSVRAAETHRHNLATEAATLEAARIRAGATGAKGEFEPSIKPLKNPVTGEDVAVLQTSRGGATLLEAKKKEGELGAVEKSAVKQLEKRIDALWKQYDALGEKYADASEEDKQKAEFHTKRFKLSMQIGDLHKQIAGLGAGKGGATAVPAARPTTRVRVKSPDGKVGTVPADQLEEALKQGYMEVK